MPPTRAPMQDAIRFGVTQVLFIAGCSMSIHTRQPLWIAFTVLAAATGARILVRRAKRRRAEEQRSRERLQEALDDALARPYAEGEATRAKFARLKQATAPAPVKPPMRR